MTPPRPTLRSLAAEAGVSAMTVSLALRGSREVSPATRKKIARLAAARGYQTDPHVVKLMHHLRTRAPARFQASIVGLAQSWPADRRAVGDYLGRLRHGLAHRAQQLGYAFETVSLDEFHDGKNLQRVLQSRGVEGIVVLPLLQNTDLGGLLDWSAFSVVSTTPSLLRPEVHSVTPNHFDNTLRVCAALARRGYRRIGLAISDDWNRRVRFRWTGGFTWQNQFGGTEPVQPLITHLPGPELEAGAFADWLRRERPDAIVTDAGIRTPLVVALTALPRARRPRIITMNWPDAACDAGIDQRPEHIGSAAIDLLAGLLTRGERGVPELPHTTMIDGVWASGKLARKRPARGGG